MIYMMVIASLRDCCFLCCHTTTTLKFLPVSSSFILITSKSLFFYQTTNDYNNNPYDFSFTFLKSNHHKKKQNFTNTFSHINGMCN